MRGILTATILFFHFFSFSQDTIPYKGSLSNMSVPEKKKASIETLKITYEKHKRNGIALLVTGGVLFLGGSSIISASASSADATLLIVSASLMGGSLPFLISGGVEMHRYVVYKLKWKKEKRALSFAPDITTHSYGAAITLSF